MLTLEGAACTIGEYPPVLVTMEEELKMTKRGFKSEGTPEERYSHIFPVSACVQSATVRRTIWFVIGRLPKTLQSAKTG